MRKAKAVTVATEGKAAWLAQRGEPEDSRKLGLLLSRPNGGGGGEGNSSRDGGTRTGWESTSSNDWHEAPVVSEVPELPDCFEKREGVFQELTHALLGQDDPDYNAEEKEDGRGETTEEEDPGGVGGRKASFMASKRNSGSSLHDVNRPGGKASRVCGIGMGGSGKTMIAASVVRASKIRRAYDRVLWLTLGQTPDLPKLQSVLYRQMTDAELPSGASLDEALGIMRRAAQGRKFLLILDDVWDPAHGLPLTVLNLEGTDSSYLVTTRLRGLFKHAVEVEVGVLDESAALELLLGTAGVDVPMPEGNESSAETGPKMAAAQAIVQCCGKLPLTLAIAGSMIELHKDNWWETVPAMLMDDNRAELLEAEGGGGGGTGGGGGDVSLEERIISASLNSLPDRDRTSIMCLFYTMAVFAEDVVIPTAIFDVLAPMFFPPMSDGAVGSESPPGKNGGKAAPNKGRMAMKVRVWLSVLLKYSLLKGSIEKGINMHDVMGAFVSSQHTPEQLRARQLQVIQCFAEGKPKFGYNARASLPRPKPGDEPDWYVGRHLYYHMRGTLRNPASPTEDGADLAMLRSWTAGAFSHKTSTASEEEKEREKQDSSTTSTSSSSSWFTQMDDSEFRIAIFSALGATGTRKFLDWLAGGGGEEGGGGDMVAASYLATDVLSPVVWGNLNIGREEGLKIGMRASTWMHAKPITKWEGDQAIRVAFNASIRICNISQVGTEAFEKSIETVLKVIDNENGTRDALIRADPFMQVTTLFLDFWKHRFTLGCLMGDMSVNNVPVTAQALQRGCVMLKDNIGPMRIDARNLPDQMKNGRIMLSGQIMSMFADARVWHFADTEFDRDDAFGAVGRDEGTDQDNNIDQVSYLLDNYNFQAIRTNAESFGGDTFFACGLPGYQLVGWGDVRSSRRYWLFLEQCLRSLDLDTLAAKYGFQMFQILTAVLPVQL